jgi:lysocardiolipin and lysophospholipid acyltransferase
MSIGKAIPAPINGLFVGLWIFFTTLFGCVTTQFFAFLFIRPFSRKWWKMWNLAASDTWFRMIIFLMEYWNGFRLRLSGDDVPDSENALVISNHPSEADWFFSWSLGWRKKSLGNVKICLKDAFRVIPGLGWSIDNLDYPFMTRKWEFDEHLLRHSLTSFIEDQYRLWFVIFPEGTDFSEAKQKRSWELAEQNGWPKYKHLLAPRTKGFTVTVQTLRKHVTHLYDLTIGYPNNEKPTFFTALAGRCPSVINIHIRRIPITDLPQKDEELKKWVFDKFKEKDELIDYFRKNQKFPGASEQFLPPGPGLSPLFAFIAWSLMVVLSFYGMFTSPTVRWIYLFAWACYVPFAHSRALRRWRGLDPPLHLTKKEQ